MQRGVQFEVFEDTAPSHKPAAPLLSKGVLLQGAENTHAKGGGKQSLVNKVSRGKSFGPKVSTVCAFPRAAIFFSKRWSFAAGWRHRSTRPR